MGGIVNSFSFVRIFTNNNTITTPCQNAMDCQYEAHCINYLQSGSHWSHICGKFCFRLLASGYLNFKLSKTVWFWNTSSLPAEPTLGLMAGSQDAKERLRMTPGSISEWGSLPFSGNDAVGFIEIDFSNGKLRNMQSNSIWRHLHDVMLFLVIANCGRNI